MKRFLILLALLFSGIAYAATETINWYVDGDTYATTTCQTGDDIILPTTPTKYGYTFQGWWGHTPIEYLESTGTQWIDTGVALYTGYTIETKFQLLSSSNRWHSPYGVESPYSFYLTMNLRENYWTLGYNSSTQYLDLTYPAKINIPVDTNIHIMKQENGKYSLDGSFFYTVNNASFYYTTLHAFLFARNANGNKSCPLVGRIYYTKIWYNNTLVRDFIPVLDEDGVPCMLDKVEGKLYYNMGTGQFIAGPIINQ